MKYPLVKQTPVARFWYKGQSHTHPVRRTVLVVESTRDIIRGYELREGNEIRKLSQAPIKSYRRDRIAKGSQLRAGSTIRKRIGPKTTLQRRRLLDILESGV